MKMDYIHFRAFHWQGAVDEYEFEGRGTYALSHSYSYSDSYSHFVFRMLSKIKFQFKELLDL